MLKLKQTITKKEKENFDLKREATKKEIFNKRK